MSKGRNIAASVRQRLLNLSRELREDFNALLAQYAVERLLYRLSQSDLADRFILKGAMLFRVWSGDLHRPTKDLDLLGYCDPAPEAVAALVRRILDTEVEDDGIVFDVDSLKAEDIRAEQEYGGVRVTLRASLERAQIPMQIDVGFGDAITPEAVVKPFPTLLDAEPPSLRMYPPETVVAEKLQALTVLDIANSRMKDFYDLLTLSRRFSFDGPTLAMAIRATFKNRGTDLPTDTPSGLSEALANDPNKQTQCSAFLKRLRIEDASGDLTEIIAKLSGFSHAATAGRRLRRVFYSSLGKRRAVVNKSLPSRGQRLI